VRALAWSLSDERHRAMGWLRSAGARRWRGPVWRREGLVDSADTERGDSCPDRWAPNTPRKTRQSPRAAVSSSPRDVVAQRSCEVLGGCSASLRAPRAPETWNYNAIKHCHCLVCSAVTTSFSHFYWHTTRLSGNYQVNVASSVNICYVYIMYYGYGLYGLTHGLCRDSPVW
jgi:hypothetical protein